MSTHTGIRKPLAATARRLRRSIVNLLPNGAQSSVPLLTRQVPPEFASGFGLLAQNMEHLASSRNKKAVLVMGAYPGDGRTTIVANLGIALARNGNRVVMVDAEPNGRSLAAAFRGDQRPAQADDEPSGEFHNGLSLAKVSGLPLHVLTLENIQKLSSGKLMDSLRSHFDFVLIDSPPFPEQLDVFRVAARCDGVIYAIRARAQNLRLLQDLKDQLDLLGVDLLGAVYSRV